MSKRIILFLFMLTMVAVSCSDQDEIAPSAQSSNAKELNSENGRVSTTAAAALTSGCPVQSFSDNTSYAGSAPYYYMHYSPKTFSTYCIANGGIVTVNVGSGVGTIGKESTNRYIIKDAANNIIVQTGWIGQYGWTWPAASPETTAQLTFVKSNNNTYYTLYVESFIHYTGYGPATPDYWSVSVSM